MTATTTIDDRASVPQILAHLILVGQRHNLPDPVQMQANAGNNIASIDLGSREDLLAWIVALGGQGKINTQTYGHAQLLHTDRELLAHRGWDFQLGATTSAPEASVLDGETLTELEAGAEA